MNYCINKTKNKLLVNKKSREIRRMWHYFFNIQFNLWVSEMQTILVNFGSHVLVLCLRIKQLTDLLNKISLTFEWFVVYVTMKYVQMFYKIDCYMAQVTLPQPTSV